MEKIDGSGYDMYVAAYQEGFRAGCYLSAAMYVLFVLILLLVYIW